MNSLNKTLQINNKDHTFSNQQKGTVLSSLFFFALIITMVLFVLYMIELDHTIVTKFEGKRWNLPAKVYSRPLDLYEGASVDGKMVEQWLQLLNYRKADNYQKTGSYKKSGSTYHIHLRGFKYSKEDKDPSQVIKIIIKDSKIKDIRSTVMNETGIVRLEPVTIGGIYPDNNEDRVVLGIDKIPKNLIYALIATEDRSFFDHHGVSVRGTSRALVNNFLGKSVQGGSTLTQQLIKNFYLNSERSLKRKANEALMALLLEIHYDKELILQTYLNEINLGQNGERSINGFGLAAQFYFNRPLNELSVDQHALLVGLAKGPSYYNPRRNPKNATERRNVVLNNMLVMGKLSQEDYDKAIEQPLGVVKKPIAGKSRFPAFLDLVKRELNEYYYADDLKNEGLRIISTLDPLAQTAADKAVEKKVGKLRKTRKVRADLQSALVSANPETGELVAVVGSKGRFTGFNRAIDARRPVGSLLKPIIYLNALEKGKYNLASSVDDSPVSLTSSDGQTWTPKNYSGIEHGQVPLLKAFANSYNQAAVRLGMEFGIKEFVRKLRLLGVEDDIQPYPALFLGSVELSPLDVLTIYQIFATGGFHTPVHSIRSVVDDKGRVLQRVNITTEQRIKPELNYLINYGLQQVVKNGTARSGTAQFPKRLNLAGKTGTTNDYRDSWFAGYSGNYVSVVWAGQDENKSIGLTGSDGALPIWAHYMKSLNLTPVKMTEPSGIEWLLLEKNDGRLSHKDCRNSARLPVLKKYIPKDASRCALSVYKRKKREKELQWQAENQAVLESSNKKEEENLEPFITPNNEEQFEPNDAQDEKASEPEQQSVDETKDNIKNLINKALGLF